MISTQALRPRIARLDQLSRGLARELTILHDADDPLLYVERREYAGAIARAHSGVEAARVALAQAAARLSA